LGVIPVTFSVATDGPSGRFVTAFGCLFSLPEDVRTVTKLVNRVLLAVIGGLVGVISVVLIGATGGPTFTGGTNLYQFFGYFGLACITVLIMRVLVAIFRDGLN
jgi:hypothetical protein